MLELYIAKTLLADVGDAHTYRIAYDQEVLEIRMVLPNHEKLHREMDIKEGIKDGYR